MVTAYGHVGGRMPLPPIPICPQEPWEAQEEAHRDRSRVKFSFCERPGVETRPAGSVASQHQHTLSVADYRLRVGHPDTTCRIFDML